MSCRDDERATQRGVATVRDRVADAVDDWRDRQPRLARKRYTLRLDLDAVAPENAEPSAPSAALDI